MDEEQINSELAVPATNGSKPKPRTPEAHRLLPSSVDAERGLLCSLLLATDEVMDMCHIRGITRHSFHLPTHQTIYSALWEMVDGRRPVDPVTLTQFLVDRGTLETAGGPAAISELFTHLPTAANAEYYIDTLTEKSMRRELIGVCDRFSKSAYDHGDAEETADLVDRFEQAALAIKDCNPEPTIVTAREAMQEAIGALQDIIEKKIPAGIMTGFDVFDEMTGGFHPATMNVIAARPSVGKTALAMNMAEYIAIAKQLPVGFFSLEMSTHQLMQRLACSRARINLIRAINGECDQDELSAITRAAADIADSKMFFDFTPALYVQDFRHRARSMVRRHGVRIIFFDYLQLARSDTKRGRENRQQEVADISTGIKAVAKELAIPIVVLAQVNRAMDKRPQGDRPSLSDLRESGAIEQDADMVAFLTPDPVNEGEESNGDTTLIIAKQRNGPKGDVPLSFFRQYTLFQSRVIQANEQPALLDVPAQSKKRKRRDPRQAD